MNVICNYIKSDQKEQAISLAENIAKFDININLNLSI